MSSLRSAMLVGLFACVFASLQAVAQTGAAPTATPTPAPPSAAAETEKAASTSPENEAAEEEALPVKHWRFGGGIYYDFASSMNFTNASFNGTTYTGKYAVDRAFGLQLEVNYTGQNAWGMQAGLMIDGRRNIKSVDNSGGVTGHTDYSSPQPTLDMSTIYFNALYRWTQVYIPFGINLTGGKINNPPTEFSNVIGGSGIQFGLGWEFNDHVATEALLRVAGLTGTSASDANGNKYELHAGSLSGWQIGVKAYF